MMSLKFFSVLNFFAHVTQLISVAFKKLLNADIPSSVCLHLIPQHMAFQHTFQPMRNIPHMCCFPIILSTIGCTIATKYPNDPQILTYVKNYYFFPVLCGLFFNRIIVYVRSTFSKKKIHISPARLGVKAIFKKNESFLTYVIICGLLGQTEQTEWAKETE